MAVYYIIRISAGDNISSAYGSNPDDRYEQGTFCTATAILPEDHGDIHYEFDGWYKWYGTSSEEKVSSANPYSFIVDSNHSSPLVAVGKVSGGSGAMIYDSDTGRWLKCETYIYTSANGWKKAEQYIYHNGSWKKGAS